MDLPPAGGTIGFCAEAASEAKAIAVIIKVLFILYTVIGLCCGVVPAVSRNSHSFQCSGWAALSYAFIELI